VVEVVLVGDAVTPDRNASVAAMAEKMVLMFVERGGGLLKKREVLNIGYRALDMRWKLRLVWRNRRKGQLYLYLQIALKVD